MKKAIYSIVVFGIIGFGLYTASNYYNQKHLKICQNESFTLGGIESCMEYLQKLES